VVLGPRDRLNGTLKVEGEVRVQGHVDGELRASGDVQIEGGSNVKASIEARNVTVRGTVTGDVTAKERLVLAGSGSLVGNVKVARLSIEDGASLNGNVTMANASQRGENHSEANKEGG
jgi:cytoskeletal protein CcmA (bactofilin family)